MEPSLLKKKKVCLKWQNLPASKFSLQKLEICSFPHRETQWVMQEDEKINKSCAAYQQFAKGQFEAGFFPALVNLQAAKCTNSSLLVSAAKCELPYTKSKQKTQVITSSCYFITNANFHM